MQNGEAVPYATYLSASAQCYTLFDSDRPRCSSACEATGRPCGRRPPGEFGWDVVPMPFVPGVNGPTRPTGAGSIAWALSSQAKNIPQRDDLLQVLFSPAGPGRLAGGLRRGPRPSPRCSARRSTWQKFPGSPNTSGAFTIAAKTGTIAPQTPNTVYNLTQTDIPKAIEAVLDNHGRTPRRSPPSTRRSTPRTPRARAAPGCRSRHPPARARGKEKTGGSDPRESKRKARRGRAREQARAGRWASRDRAAAAGSWRPT